MNIVLAHGADISKPGGGTERVSALAEGLEQGGHNVTLVVPRPSNSLPDRLDGVRTSTVPINRPGVLSQPVRGAAVMSRAKRIADERDAALQIEHSPLAGLGTMLGCRGYVLDMHDLAFPSPLYGDLPGGRLLQRLMKRMEKRGIYAATDVIVVSDRMKQLVRNTWNVPDDRFVTIPNGYFPEVTEEFADVPPVPGRVAFLGTLHPKLSVETMERISRLPEVSELVVIGDGAKRSAIERIESDALRLTGHLSDKEAFELVASAEVAINPQRVSRLQRASSPVKLYYYMALGVAMVLTEGPDIAETLGAHGAAKVIAEDGDFAGAVRQILSNDALRRSMGEASRELAPDFDWNTRVEALLKLYDR